jgi:ArsR family transcriptional regulator
LQPLFAIDQSTLSRHLAVLKNVGILGERREGTRIIHRLATPCILKVFDCTREVSRADAERRRQDLGPEL